GVERDHVPVARERDRGGPVDREPPAPGDAQLLEALARVGVVRVADRAPARAVQAPHVAPAAPPPDRARPERRIADRAAPPLTRGTLANVLEAHARDDRDAVPLVDAPCGDLVTKRLERCDGELLGLALGLLEGQDVHVRPLEE